MPAISQTTHEPGFELPPLGLAGFLGSQAPEWGYWLVEEEARLVAALPYVVRTKGVFRWMSFPTALIYRELRDPAWEKACLEALLVAVRRLRVDFIAQPGASAIFQACPNGSRCCGFGSYRVDLRRSVNELWQGVHAKHRNAIRHAAAAGTVLKSGREQLPVFHHLLSATMARSDMGVPRLEEMERTFTGLGDKVEVVVAYAGDCPQGGAFIPWTRAGAYYLYAGSAESPAPGAMNHLVWETLLQMKERGVLTFDFVGARLTPEAGSKLEGIQRFKSRFGGPLQAGHIWKFVFRPHKYRLYVNLMRMRSWLARRPYRGDIIDQECRRKPEVGNA